MARRPERNRFKRKWSIHKWPRHHLLVPNQYMGVGPQVKNIRRCGLAMGRKKRSILGFQFKLLPIEEERLALPIIAITTLQSSSRFKNLLDQLEPMVNERRIVTEAFVSIALGVRVECLATEIGANKVFLQDTNEIAFSDEDMEMGYLDHRRSFYRHFSKSHST